MDPISKFLAAYKIPIGPWGKAFFGFLTDNFDTVFRASPTASISCSTG